MASLDFEQEKINFREYYDANFKRLTDAKNTFVRIINALVTRYDVGEVTKVEGRVKHCEECIKKFRRKYQSQLETAEHPYEIKDFISDLIGVRIVCLYEDQVPRISELMQEHFNILDVTDKIATVESTEASFGYKGFHMDLTMTGEMAELPRYHLYGNLSFEIQIRSLIQDAWSVLDHKIKYKKSIPNDLKRRINVLSALFELADREFKEIRNATDELLERATNTPLADMPDSEAENQARAKRINAFNFLKVAGHFFRDFEFVDYKVDGFVEDIVHTNSDFKKSDLHRCLRDNLKTVKEYRNDFLAENPDRTFSPYAAIRHCLFLYDRKTFSRIISIRVKEQFLAWLKKSQSPKDLDRQNK